MLLPAIVAFSALGVFTVNNSGFDVYILAAFGLLGYLFMKLDCEPAPFLMGFVLGTLFEEYLRRALVFSNGDPTVFLREPISAGLIAATVLVLALVFLPAIRKKRETIFVED
jgi:TctA family transporter